jgi:pimeloyl-ACP methyl ester carboxylesterase
MTVTTRNEEPVFFDAGGEDLFGILTRPEGEGNGVVVLTLFGAGPFPTLGKNQVRIRLARELAELGYHVFRLDYRGIGESGGEPREATLTDLWIEDALGAIRWLQANGFDRIIVVGVCFGARTALAVLDELPGLEAMIMIAPPVGETNHRETIVAHPWSWYLRRAMSPSAVRLMLSSHPTARRRRSTLMAKVKRSAGRANRAGGEPKQAHASPQFLQPMGELLDRGVPTLILYGRGDDFFLNFERSMEGRLGRMIQEAGDTVAVRIVDESISGLASVATQELLLGEVKGWVGRLAVDAASATRAGDRGLQLD